MKISEQINYSQYSAGDLYLPEGKIPSGGWPVVLVIHGGAWTSLDKNSMTEVSKELCRNGLAVFNINYRLAPEHPYPAGVTDCRTAAGFLVENAGKYRLNKDLLFILGASAGGHYALLTGLKTSGYSVAGIVSISGINDVFADFAVHKERYQLLLGREASPERLREINPSEYCYDGAPEIFCTHFIADQVVPFACCCDFVSRAGEKNMKVGVYSYYLERDNQGHGIWIPEALPGKKLYPDISNNIIYFFNHIINRKNSHEQI
ncbi:MAG: alpha/beta hydrolase [Lentisphaerae bacterium]|nr:alpha/beta hydrolase [Lentisphaerota bacterium]